MSLNQFGNYNPEAQNPYWKAWEREKRVVGDKSMKVVNSFSPKILNRLESDRQSIYFCEVGREHVPFFLFRDHDGSYNSWAWLEAERGADLNGMSVIYIDAHADLPWKLEVEKFNRSDSTTTALSKTAGYFSYLIPAILDGYVGQLYWLGAPKDIKLFIIPRVSDITSRASVDVRRETDCPSILYFMASSAEALVQQAMETLAGKYALDIDLDYFLGEAYLLRYDNEDEVETKFSSRLSLTLDAIKKIITLRGQPEVVTISCSPEHCHYEEKAYTIVQSFVELIRH